MAEWGGRDERRHRDAAWEWWDFDFAAPGGLGGYVRLTLTPGGAWFWAALVGTAHPLIQLRDHDLPPLRGDALELRAEGLWFALTCETPLEHWSVGLEAFALAYDAADDAIGAELGDRVGLGFDLEWETAGDAHEIHDGYAVPCAVHGEVLLGTDPPVPLEGPGWHRHAWGDDPPTRPFGAIDAPVVHAAPVKMPELGGWLDRRLTTDGWAESWVAPPAPT